MMETGRSWTSGWGSAPLGVVIRVTCTSRADVRISGEAFHPNHHVGSFPIHYLFGSCCCSSCCRGDLAGQGGDGC